MAARKTTTKAKTATKGHTAEAATTAKKRHRRQDVDWFVHENIDALKGNRADLTAAMVVAFGFSRQAASNHIKRLLDAGSLKASGEDKAHRLSIVYGDEEFFFVPLKGLAEDVLWRQRVAERVVGIAKNVEDLLFHGFTEMVNNAVDHSEGTSLGVGFSRSFAAILIDIVDDGIGIFKKIKESCGLEEEHHALLELAKGKLTTAQAHHSGEGIFFTSRACDRFIVSSGKLSLIRWGQGEESDYLLIDRPAIEGTRVYLVVRHDSQRTMEKVYEEYTSGDGPSFSKTIVPVKLAAYQGEGLVSRSQAKRLLARFDRFETIILDFQDVPSIGQGFADEIFRVFANAHPHIRLVPTRTNDAVRRMVKHVTGRAVDLDPKL